LAKGCGSFCGPLGKYLSLASQTLELSKAAGDFLEKGSSCGPQVALTYYLLIFTCVAMLITELILFIATGAAGALVSLAVGMVLDVAIDSFFEKFYWCTKRP
jgi:hypothetical protein